jgi:hypothetical protein
VIRAIASDALRGYSRSDLEIDEVAMKKIVMKELKSVLEAVKYVNDNSPDKCPAG